STSLTRSVSAPTGLRRLTGCFDRRLRGARSHEDLLRIVQLRRETGLAADASALDSALERVDRRDVQLDVASERVEGGGARSGHPALEPLQRRKHLLALADHARHRVAEARLKLGGRCSR